MNSSGDAMNQDIGRFFGLLVLGAAWLAVTVNRLAGNPIPSPELTGLLVLGVAVGFAMGAWLACAATRVVTAHGTSATTRLDASQR